MGDRYHRKPCTRCRRGKHDCRPLTGHGGACGRCVLIGVTCSKMTGDLASFTVAPSGFDTDEPAGGHSTSSGRMPLPSPSFKSTPDVVPLPPMPYHHSFSLQQNPLNPVFAHGPTLYISPGVFPGAVNLIVPLTPDLASMYGWNQSMLLQPPAYPQ
ncbi:hypothetical protein HGRIS_011160 [Hohenbuehelia grisea]|uniref:Zn(2)-C6 fungal-type domain-containing protein n=1 Tax=Hohenbuehelia grisea TaxID=104357 RepID=A0ABR3IZ58_9AGAR